MFILSANGKCVDQVAVQIHLLDLTLSIAQKGLYQGELTV